MQKLRIVPLQRSGQDQVITIPPEFAVSGKEATLRKEGHRLIIEPISSNSLLSLLTTLQDIPEDFPDVDEGLPPLDDVTL